VSDCVEVHGYNAASGLPRAPALAIRRGSCIAFSGPGDKLSLLAQLFAKRDALGERTAEGFGQLRIDLAELAGMLRPTSQASGSDIIARREELLATAEGISTMLVWPGQSEPSTSQWMALWNALHATRDHSGILQQLSNFESYGERLGGRAWKSVQFAKLREAVEGDRVQNGHSPDAQADMHFFLDAVIGNRIQKARATKRGENTS
jgi:hypothetical protein